MRLELERCDMGENSGREKNEKEGNDTKKKKQGSHRNRNKKKRHGSRKSTANTWISMEAADCSHDVEEREEEPAVTEPVSDKDEKSGSLTIQLEMCENGENSGREKNEKDGKTQEC